MIGSSFYGLNNINLFTRDGITICHWIDFLKCMKSHVLLDFSHVGGFAPDAGMANTTYVRLGFPLRTRSGSCTTIYHLRYTKVHCSVPNLAGYIGWLGGPQRAGSIISRSPTQALGSIINFDEKDYPHRAQGLFDLMSYVL